MLENDGYNTNDSNTNNTDANGTGIVPENNETVTKDQIVESRPAETGTQNYYRTDLTGQSYNSRPTGNGYYQQGAAGTAYTQNNNAGTGYGQATNMASPQAAQTTDTASRTPGKTPMPLVIISRLREQTSTAVPTTHTPITVLTRLRSLSL